MESRVAQARTGRKTNQPFRLMNDAPKNRQGNAPGEPEYLASQELLQLGTAVPQPVTARQYNTMDVT